MSTTELRGQLQTALGDAYRIDRELAPGGMSRLFLATERSLDRYVVIKLLPPEYASEVSAARFQREVTLTAQLQHPHILPILSAASNNGLLYYITPYVEGESLRHRLEREGRLPVGAALQILGEVADALALAHEAGVVHRDIKPENILLHRDHAMLADFGVARALHDTATSDRLTQTGTGLGTPGYMAPEQLAGERNVDARADVYALAVVGYEMLAGVSPFTGSTPQAVASARFTSAAKPLIQIRPDIPRSASEAIAKALSSEPDQRFASATEFRDALTAGRQWSAAPARLTRARAVAGGIVLALVALTSVVVVWHRHAEAPIGPPTLAIIPFENQGDSADDYFADGMTDEVRSKLSALPGIQVIASASSNQYRHTAKPPEQIGRELGVRYLLTGRIRWQKLRASSRVRVEPELVQVGGGAHATTRWQQPFDADLSDVFKMQTTIAEDVVTALRIALDTAGQGRLEMQPTRNLAAYDAFLRGEALTSYPRKLEAFAQAIALDSSFALAWAELSLKTSGAYTNVEPTPERAKMARLAAERALAIAPQLPSAHEALATYYQVVAKDERRGLAEAQAGLRVAPSDAYLLYDCAFDEVELGRWDDAVASYREATRLDPMSTEIATFFADALMYLRRFPEARAEADRAVALSPHSPFPVGTRVMVSLAEGDMADARAVVRSAKRDADSTALFAWLANYYDLVWVLDSGEQRYVTRLPAAAFGDNRATWGLVLAQAYALVGDRGKARTYADSARLAFEVQLQATPDDPQLHALHGLALAYLGRRDSAVHEAQRAGGMSPLTVHQRESPYLQHQLVRIYLQFGETANALDALEPLLRRPYYVTPGWLRIDPNFAPLRGNPRFEQLVAEPMRGSRP